MAAGARRMTGESTWGVVDFPVVMNHACGPPSIVIGGMLSGLVRKNRMSDHGYLEEPTKKVPIACDVDVVVAGAGISGLLAALSAGRSGAKTVLVDRFGTVGGNIGGAGMFMALNGLGLNETPRHTGVPGYKLVGIGKELCDRFQALLGDMPRNNSTVSLAVSRVAFDMLEENGVELMLSAYAADPIVEGDRVTGLFVETKSGRVAVRAKVTIDGTGDADLATRAGAPTIWPTAASELDYPWCWEFVKLPQYKSWNDGGMSFVIADVDWEKYEEYLKTEVELTREDFEWRDKLFQRNSGHMWIEDGVVKYEGRQAKVLFPLMREAAERGEYFLEVEVRENVHVYPCLPWQDSLPGGLVLARMQASGDFDMSDWQDVSLIESASRKCIFDMVRFYRDNVPGFENAWLVCEPAFLGMRGGRCIDGEYTITMDNCINGLEADDVLFVTHAAVIRRPEMLGCDHHDMPYRMLQPKGLDGMLVAGRGAAFIRRGHDPSIRQRNTMIMLGQATGIAAAMAAAAGVMPKELNVKELQKALLKEGFFLGSEERVKALGLPTDGITFPRKWCVERGKEGG